MNSPNTATSMPTSGWSRRLIALMACMLLAFLAIGAGNAFAVPPPAGTSIGNQASATFTDASGISRSVSSNVVNTIVQQVAALTLTANGAQTSTAGSTVYYPHTLTNTGNGTDTYGLTAVNASGPFSMTGIQIFADNGSGQPTGPAITTSPALGAGGVFKFIVVAVVPPTATSGQINGMTVTATSVLTPATKANNTDTTTVTNNGVIVLSKGISANTGAAGSGPYTYTLTYTNTGNTTATAVTITDFVPAGMTYIAASSRWSVSGATALSDAGGTTGSAPNTIVSTYTGASVRLRYIVNQVTPGQSGTITFNVNVNAGVAPGVQNNTATDTFNDGTGAIISDTSNTVPFTVTQIGGVTLTGSTVPSANPGALVPFTNIVTNTGNGTDTFDVTFGANNFPAGTSFTLYKSDGVTPLVDTNGNNIPDTGPLAPGATYNVIVKAQLPANATGGPYTLNKTATSGFDPTKTATTTDTLTVVNGAAVDLTNTSAFNAGTPAPGQGPGPEVAAVLSKAINPGQITSFPVFVNNTGPVADSYVLGASTVSNFSSVTLPTGWTVVFKADGGTGTCSTTGATVTTPTPIIASGSNLLVCAVVTTPATGAGAGAGTTDLFFRAVSASSGAQDTIHDAVTLNAVRSVTFTPNNTNQTYPGGIVVYSHTLTNNGDVVEGNGTVSTITFATANSKASWTSVMYYDANTNGVLDAADIIVPAGGIQLIPALAAGLAPGQAVTIFNKETAPAGAQLGDVDTATITVTTVNGTYIIAAPAPAIATDQTTVIAGNLTLVKNQALDAACTGPTGGTVYSAANVNALPGQCVLYQITATNVGSANATNVVVSDATPSYTTLSSLATTTVGTITGPALTATGSISATVGTLTPSQVAIVVFGVKINP